ncbi:MAG: elongation factor 1-beta [Nitrososphaerales archaeon]
MARLVARIKVLPTDIDIELDNILGKLKSSLPDGMGIKKSAKEPIAYGLNALMVDFLLDDKEGQMDALENAVRQTEGVSEVQVVSISRESTSLG